MSSTILPPRTPAAADRVAPSIVPGGGRQRRWSLALLAVLMTLGSALAFVVLWMNAGDRKPVLVLRNDVIAGQIIEADDLGVARVSADGGVRLVSSSARDDVVGRPAAVNLLAGTLLVADAVGSADGLETGTAVMSVPVPRAQLPDGLDTGDQVTIYATSDRGDGEASAAEAIAEGRVFSVGDGDDSASEIPLSIVVDETSAPAIANAVQAEQFIIAKTSAG
jgi:SAF domain